MIFEEENTRSRLRAKAQSLAYHRAAAGRSNPAVTVELWQAVLCGRCSLVDNFESDGRRYLLLRKNDAAEAARRALSPRQREVLLSVAKGHSRKEIAYALGLSVSSVATHLGRALSNIGLRSRAEWVRVATQLLRVSELRAPLTAA